MLFFVAENSLNHDPRGGIVVGEMANHLLVNLDHDALGDQVFLDHVRQRLAFGILRSRTLHQRSRVEIRFAAELLDAFRNFVGVFAFRVGVFLELIAHRHGVDAGGHEVVVHVAQHAYDLRSQRVIQNGDGLFHVTLVGVGYRSVFDFLRCALAYLFHIGHKTWHKG